MLKSVTLSAATLGLMMLNLTSVHGNYQSWKGPAPQTVEPRLEALAEHPGKHDTPSTKHMDWPSSSAVHRQRRLEEIIKWLAANFDLPAIAEYPRIAFATTQELAAMRYETVSTQKADDRVGEVHGRPGSVREVVAVYDDARRTIMLAHGWTGTTSTEASILVHEMVHHLQNLGQLKYPCPEAREKIAYDAQQQWLAQSGHSLQEAFGLDAITLLVSTRCMH